MCYCMDISHILDYLLHVESFGLLISSLRVHLGSVSVALPLIEGVFVLFFFFSPSGVQFSERLSLSHPVLVWDLNLSCPD